MFFKNSKMLVKTTLIMGAKGGEVDLIQRNRYCIVSVIMKNT